MSQPLIGVDLVPLARVGELLDPGAGPVLGRFLSADELAASRTPDGEPDRAGIAGRLAAKEAVFKLLGAVGRPVPWQGIEVLRGPGGARGSGCRVRRPSWRSTPDSARSTSASATTAASRSPSRRPPPPAHHRSTTSSRWISDFEGNAMSSAGIDKVRDWILGRHPERTELAADVDLIESRLVDSLAFVELVYTIEDAAGVEIDFDTIDIEDFQTLATIEKAFFA
ncbi:4'-phosphopantetheinyl transferase superfamily protein [Streptomyces sp. MT29]|nr:4'-phosphopantetheinyl transferase superfamily protein [Streptomyces sp. MT29]